MKYPFPKVDLHFHLDGSIVPEVGWRIAQEEGVDLYIPTYEDYIKLTTVPPLCTDVFEYLAKFGPIVKMMQTKEHLTRITYTTIKRARDEGLFYVEIRFAPQLHTQKGLTQRDAVEAVLEGVRKAAVDFPEIKVGIILCCMIELYENHEENMETVRLTEEYLGKGVVAIDLAGGEDSVPMAHYADLFVDYHKKGLPMTIHAGDNGIPQNVATVIDWGATRVGHGKHCWYDKDVMQKVIDTGATLEVCLTSNIQCRTENSYREHPMKKLYDAGVKVTFNTDNQSISNITLEDEYDHAINDLGFTYNDLILCNINSIECSFMPEEEKPAYIEKLRSYPK